MGNAPVSNIPETSQNTVNQACPKEIMDAYYNIQKNPLTTEWVDTRNLNASCAGKTVSLVAPIQWIYILLSFVLGIFLGVMIDKYMLQKNTSLQIPST
jgi:hypothetical protein